MWKKIKTFFKWAIEYPDPEKKEEASAIIRKNESDESDESWREDTVWEEEESKRARDKKGQYRGDDKSTPDVNEAWVGGKSPNKKKRHKKKKKKKKRK